MGCGMSDVKDKIVALVIDMLNQGMSPDEVTVRQITNQLGISVSTINYHFENKDNLMRVVTGLFVDNIRAMLMDSMMAMEDLAPRERLKRITKDTADYLVEYASVARQVILADISGDAGMRDSFGLVEFYQPILLEQMDETLANTYSMMLCFSLQGMFLRMDALNEQGALDFSDKLQRDRAIDDMFAVLRGLRRTVPTPA